MKKDIEIMGHLVIGYPSLEKSLEIAFTYIQNGIKILELQIPFSAPMADGPTIVEANKVAIANGATFEDSLDFISKIKAKYPSQEIYVMSYLNKIVSHGWAILEKRLEGLGVEQLIIPDLPLDSVETFEMEQNGKIQIVPVLGVNINNARLENILQKKPKFIYIMSNFKITGSEFDMHQSMTSFIEYLRSHSDAKIGIGFGVNSHQDALEVSKIADIVIVGSSLIEAEKKGVLVEKINELRGR